MNSYIDLLGLFAMVALNLYVVDCTFTAYKQWKTSANKYVREDSKGMFFMFLFITFGVFCIDTLIFFSKSLFN
jgi:hypothetical protein